jgi:hypothetical protein
MRQLEQTDRTGRKGRKRARPIVLKRALDKWRARRFERQAAAQIERGVLEVVRDLAAAGGQIGQVVDLQRHSGQPIRGAGAVSLTLGGWKVMLAGVASRPRRELAAASAGPLRLGGAGRYGRYWWIEVQGHPDALSSPLVLVGSHLRTLPVAATRIGRRRRESDG